jgi:hypothetical protein
MMWRSWKGYEGLQETRRMGGDVKGGKRFKRMQGSKRSERMGRMGDDVEGWEGM